MRKNVTLTTRKNRGVIIMDVSVVSATYNRAELLDNALQTYSKQIFPKDSWEYILVDDSSTDNTKEIARKWAKKINLIYLTNNDVGMPKVPGRWRDGCGLRNRASTYASGRLLIITHPEIMVPPTALKSVYTTALTAECKSWITAIPYWMPAGTLPKGWKTDLSVVRNMPGFYDPSWPDAIHSPGGVDYRNQNQEIRDSWESEVFAAFQMKDWLYFGGFQEFEVWGSVDVDQMNRRRAAGFKTVFAKDEHSPHKDKILMVYHQNHDSKRDMGKAMKALEGKNYHSVQQAREVGGLFRYPHPPHTFDRVRKILNAPKKALENKETLIQLICEFGLHSDILNPYDEEQRRFVSLGIPSIWQRPEQYASLLLFMKDNNIRKYCEIGIGDAGTLLFTTAYLKAVNPEFDYSYGVEAYNHDKVAPAIGESNLPIRLIHGASSDLDFELDEKIDLVFIDGDHSYEGVMKDWNNARGWARFVAFHDIDANVLPDCKKAWSEISLTARMVATFTEPKGVMGIGVIE